MKYIPIDTLRAMSDDELRKLSLMKNARGTATVVAKRAQHILYEERSCRYVGVGRVAPSYQNQLIKEKGTGKFYKKFH